MLNTFYMIRFITLLLCLSLFSFNGEAQKSSKSNLAKMPSKDSLDPGLFSTFKFRSLGPALTSGRIADIAVNIMWQLHPEVCGKQQTEVSTLIRFLMVRVLIP